MNSEFNFQSLTELILNNNSVQIILNQSIVIHSIYSKENASDEYTANTGCIGKSLPECLNLDLAKQIVEMINKVKESNHPGLFEIKLRTRTGEFRKNIEIIQLPGDHILITIEPHQKQDFGLSDSLERQIITEIIKSDSIDQVANIILNAIIDSFKVLGGGVYIYQFSPGNVSHKMVSKTQEKLIEEIHHQIKNSSYWINVSNGYTLLLTVDEIKQLVDLENISDDVRSFLFLPIYTNNMSFGNIILATRFTNFSDIDHDLMEYYYPWIVQVLTTSINFRRLSSEFFQYQNILNEIQDYCFVLSPQGKIIFSNSAFQSKVKYSDFELKQLQLLDIVPALRSEVEGLITSGAEVNQNWRPLVYVDKFNNQFSLMSKLIFSSNGLLTVISQKEKTEITLMDMISDAVSQMNGSLSQPILLLDEATLSIIFANQQANHFYGFNEKELIDKNFLELISETDHQFLFNSVRKNGVFNFDEDRIWEQKTNQKTRVQSRFTSTTLNYEGKRSILLIIREIEDDRIPSLIRDVSGFYNLLNQDLVILRLSPEGIITHANEYFSELIGKPLEKMIGKSFEENLFIEDYESIFNHFSKLTPQIPIRKNTNRIIGANGRTIWVEWTDRGIFDGEDLLEIYAIGKDITQEMQRELIDQSNEERYQALIETLPLVIYIFHVETHFPLYVSPQIKSITGYDADEFYKNQDFWSTILHPDDAKEFYIKTMERMEKNSSEPIEFRMIHKDGGVHWLEEIGSTITLSDGTKIFQGAVRDITESQENKEKLEYFNKISRVLIEASLELLRANSENYSIIIQKTIAKIGNSLQVDRVIVFEKDTPDISSSTTHEWCNEGIPSQKERLQSVAHSAYPWWRENMENNKEIIMDSVNDLPAEAKAERENILAKEIKSLVAMPLYSRGRITGWMGFDMVRKEVHWEREEINLLRLLSALIVNTNERIFSK